MRLLSWSSALAVLTFAIVARPMDAAAKGCRGKCGTLAIDKRLFGGEIEEPTDRVVTQSGQLTWTFRHPKNVGTSELRIELRDFRHTKTGPPACPGDYFMVDGQPAPKPASPYNTCGAVITFDGVGNDRHVLTYADPNPIRIGGVYTFHLVLRTNAGDTDLNDIDPELEIDPSYLIVLQVLVGLFAVTGFVVVAYQAAKFLGIGVSAKGQA